MRQSAARRAKRTAFNSDGFTLVEVVMTVVILTSLALGSMLVIVPVARQSRLNKEVDIANTEARRVLEKVQATPFKEITLLYPDNTTIPVTELKSGTVSINYTDPTADPLFLEVTIAWEGQDGGDYSRTFLTLRTE